MRLSPRLMLFWPAASLAFALGGCVPDHAQSGLEIATPAQFAAGAERRLAPPPRAWLASFDSTELTRLGALGESRNLDIKAAIARIEQADAQALATAASLYPTLSLGAGASQTFSPGVARSVDPPYRSNHTPLFGLNLAAAYQLDFWGRNRDVAEAARLDAQASRFDRDVIALSTEAAIANLYFQLLAAQDRLAVARGNVKLATQVLEAVRGRRAVGTSSALDDAQQETIVAQQRAAIPPLEQAIGQTRNTLAVLIGQTPESARIRGGSLKGLRSPTIRAGLPAQVLERRPDVAEAEAKFAAQGFSVESARAAFLPNLSLTGQTGLASEALKSFHPPQAVAYALAASLTQPIFDGGTLQAQFESQKGRYTELLETYRKQVLTAFADVENALIGMQKSREKLRLQEQAASAARKAYEAADLLLKGGTIDIVTLATTENTYFQALDAEVQARAAYFQAATALYQALGGGWTQDGRSDAQVAFKE